MRCILLDTGKGSVSISVALSTFPLEREAAGGAPAAAGAFYPRYSSACTCLRGILQNPCSCFLHANFCLTSADREARADLMAVGRFSFDPRRGRLQLFFDCSRILVLGLYFCGLDCGLARKFFSLYRRTRHNSSFYYQIVLFYYNSFQNLNKYYFKLLHWFFMKIRLN